MTDKKTMMPLAFLLAVFTDFGIQLDRSGRVLFAGAWTWAGLVGLFCLFWFLIVFLWKVLDQRKERTGCGEIKRRTWILLYLGLVCSYTISFCAVFPGFFTYDATMAYLYVTSNSYFDQHPFLHVFALGKSVILGENVLGSANAGIAVFLYTQMLIVAAAFIYCLYKIAKSGCRKGILIAFYLYYLLFPTIHMYALCSTKDTLYTVCFLVLLIKLKDLVEDGDAFFAKRGYLLFSIALLGFLYLRNNSLYAWCLFAVVLILLVKKQKKKTGLMILVLVVVHLVINGAINHAFVHYSVGYREFLSVPGQQLARVYHERPEVLTDREQELLFTFYGREDVENYMPKLSDPVKNGLRGSELSAKTKEYVDLWFKVGLKAPDIYVNSFLVNTYQFWYPFTEIDGYVGYYGMKDTVLEDAKTSYFGYVTEPPGERQSLIPALDRLFLVLSKEKLSNKLPILYIVFQPGIWFWVLLTCVFYNLHRKNKKGYLPLLLILAVWLTLQLGPIALVRYVLILFFGLPFILNCFQAGEPEKTT